MKNLLSVFLCLIIILGICPIINASSIYAVGIFSEGDGTKENPYRISTPDQLDAVRNDLSAHYIQTKDIDLASIDNWVPIGLGSGSYSTINPGQSHGTYEPFDGSYDGAGYKILNLTINSGEYDNVGFFGLCTERSSLLNINLQNININVDKSSTDYVEQWKNGTIYAVSVGGIAGRTSSIISNCTVKGKINVINCNDANVGGITGSGRASGSINYSDIYVLSNRNARYVNSGSVHVGGIVGHSSSVNGLLSRNLNHGSVSATAGSFVYCGGISGEYGKIEYCVNYAEVSGKTTNYTSTSSFAGNCNVGGIVGANSSDGTTNCVNYGNIKSYALLGGSSYSGGIIGYSGYYGYGTISNCYNVNSIINSTRQTKVNNVYVDTNATAGRIAGSLLTNRTSECYSINTTRLNGDFPVNNIGANLINGGSMSLNEILEQASAISDYVPEIVKSNEYGVTKYYDSLKNQLIKAANEWNNARVSYVEAVVKQCETEKKTNNNDDTVLADAATKMKTYGIDLSSAISITGYKLPQQDEIYCYQALLDVFNSDKDLQKKLELGNINVSADQLKLASDIVKRVGKAFKNVDSEPKRYGKKYDISVKILGYSGTFFGYMECVDTTIRNRTYRVNFTSSQAAINTALNDYIKELAKLSTNAYEYALKAAITDLTGYSGFGNWAKIKLDKKVNDLLKEKGFGDINFTLGKCYDYYKFISKAFDGVPNDSDMLIYANDIANQANNIMFGDSNITSKVTKKAFDELSKKQANATRVAIDYINGRDIPSDEPEKGFVNFIKSIFKCPVDIVIYNKDGVEIGHVIGDDIDYSSDLLIIKESDVKIIYSNKEDDISFKIIGTDYGLFDYAMEEYVDEEPTGRLNFYDIELYEGRELTAVLPINELSKEKENIVLNSDEGFILSDEYFSVNDDALVSIKADCTDGGFVTGSGAFVKGDSVMLVANPLEGYLFAGWYDGEDRVSARSRYGFSAREDVTLIAKFIKIDLNNYKLTVLDDYTDKMGIFIEEDENIVTLTINILPDTDLNIDDFIFYIAHYDGNKLVNISSSNGKFDNDGYIKYSGTLPENNFKLFLLNKNMQPVLSSVAIN